MWKRTVSWLAGALIAAVLAAPAAATDPIAPSQPAPSQPAPSQRAPAPPPPLMGRPRAGGPVEIQLQSLHLEATVANGVAHVRSEQRFVNQTQVPAEGSYVFPLPQGATVSSFQMFVDGQAYTAEVLTADKARAVYESIVQRNRDPALLQYIGQGLLQARIFPVPPGAERRIKVEYDQVLPRDGGLSELTLPISADAVPQASITVNLNDLGSGSVYSPTHNVAVTRKANGSAAVSYEGSQARGDFKLFFGQQSDKLGVNLLTYKSGTEDGYFMLLVNPPSQQTTEIVAKDVILAIDLSGSMEGEKFTQAKGAALQILGALGKQDRFGVIGFHSDVLTYADELRSAADVEGAMQYVRNLKVGGATNISDAMARAQQLAGKNAGRPQVIILITDGQPTAGETYPERIISSVHAAATGSQRIFTFGVGYDVNTILLDGMAQENRGRSDYIKPGENLESAVGAFWRKIGQPVLSDVSLNWEGVKAEEIYPRPIGDLYLGSQMVLLGRYRQAADAKLTVSGKVNDKTAVYTFDSLNFTANDTTRDYIPRLWANRKVGYLLGEIQRNGQMKESIDEVVALSQRFGIVTPYTSFFVNEPGGPTAATPPRAMPMPDGGRGLGQGAPGSDQQRKAAASVANQAAAAPQSGQSAVETAKKLDSIRGAYSLSDTKAPAGAADQMRTAGDKTFILKQGVWVDTAYQGTDLLYLKLGSDRYLALARSRPELARYLSVGSPLILVDGKAAYAVDIPGKEESDFAIPATVFSQPGPTAARPALGLWLGGGAAATAGVAGVVAWRRRRRPR